MTDPREEIEQIEHAAIEADRPLLASEARRVRYLESQAAATDAARTLELLAAWNARSEPPPLEKETTQ
jgi:hypothetical protein